MQDSPDGSVSAIYLLTLKEIEMLWQETQDPIDPDRHGKARLQFAMCM